MSNEHHTIELQGSVWMTVGGQNFGGPGRITLLSRIAECGSITQAAKSMKMSYKAAWDAIETMNTLAGEPLVQRSSGGKGGGGTTLTARGLQLVENFRVIEAEHRRFVDSLGKVAGHLADDYVLLRKMSIRTSARNQFFGTITDVTRGTVNDEVTLEVAPGLRIVATVTHDCVEELQLTVGVEAFALITSAAIMLARGEDGIRFSARNQLRGTVAGILAGAVNTEVTVAIADGIAIAAVITNESCDELGLAPGDAVTALFRESSVIVGIPG